MNISTAIEGFLLSCRAERKAVKTMRGYSDVLHAFFRFTGDIPTSEIHQDHIRRYMASLLDKPGKRADRQFSPQSMMKHFQVIRTWMHWMEGEGYISLGIIGKVKAPDVGERLPSTLSDAEVRALFDYLKLEGRRRDAVIFSLFLDTGLRLEEVANLTLTDLHIHEGWARIIGKGDKEEIVPLGNRCSRDLYLYINNYRKANPGEDGVFVVDSGYRITYDGLAIMIRRAISKIRIGDGKRGAHVLRHTMATNFLRAGGGLETLRKILRHNDIKVTQIYIHLAKDDVIEEHRRLSPLDFVYRR